MKKIIFGIIVFVLVIALLGFVLASPPAPTPACYIKGVIQSVEFREAYNESCLSNCDRNSYAACCPTDREYEHPERYFLNVSITKVSYIEGTTEYSTCDKLFPLNSEQIIIIDKKEVKEGDSFIIHQKIEGQISQGFNRYFDSYTINSDFGSPSYLIYSIIPAVMIIAAVLFFISRKKK